MAKFCGKCGSEVTALEKFCPKCGTNLATDKSSLLVSPPNHPPPIISQTTLVNKPDAPPSPAPQNRYS